MPARPYFLEISVVFVLFVMVAAMGYKHGASSCPVLHPPVVDADTIG